MNFTTFPSFKVILLLFLWGYSTIIHSQTLTSELYSKLPASDQKKLQKAAELDSKGKSIEDEATQILSSGSNEDDQEKNAKKYYQKLIEASKYYRERNSVQYKVYDGNIKTFWKNYKGEKQGLNSAHAMEPWAADSFKRAAELRFMADKANELPAKFALIAQARRLENTSLQMLQKILYVYLNWPVEYTPEWLAADNMDFPSVYNKQTNSVTSLPPANDTRIDTTENENDSSLYTMVRINEEQIDMFNDFLKNTYPASFESYIINFSNLQFSDIDSIRNAWYAYLYQTVPADSLQMLANVQDSSALAGTDKENLAVNTVQPTGKKSTKTGTSSQSLADNTKKSSATSQYESKNVTPSNAQSSSTDNLTDNTTQSSSVAQNKTKSSKTRRGKKDVVTTSLDAQSDAAVSTSSAKDPRDIVTPGKVISYTAGTSTNSLFIFRVQIAACRVKLDEQTLRGIYNGVEDIQELYEDNWYKYTVGEYPTYLEARNLRNKLQIPGAFVTAYLKGKRINATPFHPNKRTLGARIARGMDPDLIEFRLQIAACKTPLSQEFLQNIYNGEKNIDTIHEEGWYKYSLLAGRTVNDALLLLKRVQVPGAFIVAYHQNIKLDLYEAIRFTKKFNQ